MQTLSKYATVLSVPLILGCSLLNRASATEAPVETAVVEIATGTAVPPSAASPAASGPTQDACTQDTLRVYLRQFAMPMAAYEFGLIQVYDITNASNASASADKYNAALGMIQTAHDTIAALQPPDCAAKMQSDMLSSMEDMKAAIQLRISGASNAQFEAAMSKTKAEQKAAEDEFGVLSARAGLNAASPTP